MRAEKTLFVLFARKENTVDTLLLVIMVGGVSITFAVYLNRELKAIQKAIIGLPVLEVRRLEQILKLEIKSGVSPETFRANKEALKKRVATAVISERHPSPDTQAFLILDRSGLALFLEGSTRAELQRSLGRLVANGDVEGTKTFLNEVVDQL